MEQKIKGSAVPTGANITYGEIHPCLDTKPQNFQIRKVFCQSRLERYNIVIPKIQFSQMSQLIDILVNGISQFNSECLRGASALLKPLDMSKTQNSDR